MPSEMSKADEDFLRNFETQYEEVTKEEEVKEEVEIIPTIPEVTSVEEENKEVDTPEVNQPEPKNKEENKDTPLFDGLTVTSDKKEEPVTASENKSEDTTTPKELDYVAQYNEAVAPLRADGKTIQIQSISELRRLAQMGIGANAKFNAIAADRKYLALLEQHGLKDETKLSYVVDLLNKNPEAIRKLVSDSGVDPLDIDTSAPNNYVPVNRAVPEADLNFRDMLTELNSAPTGMEIINKVFNSWDTASQGQMWHNPDAMRILHTQKQVGIFDIVENEVERRFLMGMLPANISRLDAYQQVGRELGNQGAFNHLGNQQAPVQQQSTQTQPLAVKVVTPKPSVSGSDKVAAAAPTKAVAKKSSTMSIEDISKLSDEEFLKLFPRM